MKLLTIFDIVQKG